MPQLRGHAFNCPLGRPLLPVPFSKRTEQQEPDTTLFKDKEEGGMIVIPNEAPFTLTRRRPSRQKNGATYRTAEIVVPMACVEKDAFYLRVRAGGSMWLCRSFDAPNALQMACLTQEQWDNPQEALKNIPRIDALADTYSISTEHALFLFDQCRVIGSVPYTD